MILVEHSRAQCTRIINWVGDDQERFDHLVQLVLDGEYVVGQRGSWAISDIALQKPGMIQKHLGVMLKNLKKPDIHNAVKRKEGWSKFQTSNLEP